MITQNLEPILRDSPATAEQIPTAEREISIHVQPDVALHQSRGRNARRQMARKFTRVFTIAIGDICATAAATLVVRQLAAYVSDLMGRTRLPESGLAEACVAMVVALALTGNYQRTSPGHPTRQLFMGSVLGALVVSWATLWGPSALVALPVAVALALAALVALFLTREAVTRVTAFLLPEERRLVPAILVTSGARGEPALSAASGYRAAATLAIDWRQADFRAQDLARLIRRNHAEAVVVLGAIRSSELAKVLEISMRAGCEVLCSPPAFEVAGVRAAMVRCGPYALVHVASPSFTWQQLFAKRCVDVVGSIVALILTLPLWLLAAVAIRLDSPGPILFSQERVGLGGRRFRMLKFRTMREDAEQEKGTLAHMNVTGDRRLFKIPHDPRISRAGHFLRRWSLDELPQLLNVLRGHMSLVGPRPFFEDDFVDYEEHHFRRLGAKPGITGVWQVYGRSTVMDFEEVVRMDTGYIDGWSLWLDFKILVMTVPAVLQRTGAY